MFDLMMSTGVGNSSLLFDEIPLSSSFSRKNAPQEIFVVEGSEVSGTENIVITEAGGGVSLKMSNATRVICWRTHGNKLELFEYSFDLDLHSSHFMIVFEDSKVLPDVRISVSRSQLKIVCCTITACHLIMLDIRNINFPQEYKPGCTYPSLLESLPSFDFSNQLLNYHYGQQIQGYASSFSADALSYDSESDRHISETVIGLTTSNANMIVVKMSDKASPTHFVINQTSRMSRIWSGINPWSAGGCSDIVADLRIVALEGIICAVAVFKDIKLRVWCCKTQELLLNEDLNDHILETSNRESCVCKIRANSGMSMLLVYVASADQARFLQYKVIQSKGRGNLELKFFSVVSSTIASQDMPHCQLIDYLLTSDNRLVALWRDMEDVDSVSVCRTDEGKWYEGSAQAPPVPVVPIQPYQDVREAYMDYLFTAGRFCPTAIVRALSIHNKAVSLTGSTNMQHALREMVSAHVQTEILNQEVDNEENMESIHLTAWSSFYQTCVQYQQVFSRSLGLTTCLASHDGDAFISIIKKGYVSVLSPVSALEAACRDSDPAGLIGILPPEECSGRRMDDLVKLLKCLGILHGLLDAELLDSVQQSIRLGGNNPIEVIEDVLPDILDLSREFMENIDNLLAGVEYVTVAVRMLLICLEPKDLSDDFDDPDVRVWPAGSQGTEFLSRCVQGHIENRFQLSVLLLIFMSFPKVLQNQDDTDQLRARITIFIQAYQAIYWLSSVETQSSSQYSLESTMQSLSVHGLKESSGNVSGQNGGISTASHLKHGNVLDLFLSVDGGKLLHAFLKARKKPDSGRSAHALLCSNVILSPEVVPDAVNFLVYLMWPLGPTLTMPDFLLSHGHHTILQRYLQRDLGDWCGWCPKSRTYMLAHCHFHHGHYDKAVQSFILAASGLKDEDYLVSNLLWEDDDNLNPVAKEILYYTKVLPLFEKLDLSEQVINLAYHAIQVAKSQEDNPNLPTLWSSVFRQSNHLSWHLDAFKAIVLNPDPEHRKDCLRTLAVSLCELKKYKTLVEFQYGELEDDLVSILEHRARGTDLSLSSHNYYDLLYAFYVHRGNYRRAASAMYEQGYRLSCELSSSSAAITSVPTLKKQLACYVACINCLHLVAPDNRWILHPKTCQAGDMMNREFSISRDVKKRSPCERQDGYKSPKRQHDGEVAKKSFCKVFIKELPEIQKESFLIETRIDLAISGNSTGPLITPEEIISLLSHSGLFDMAISLSTKFNLSLTSIFELLTSRCVYLSYASDKDAAEACEWLQENETAKIQCSRGRNSTLRWSPADAAYRLLQVYLERHGDAELTGSCYYRAVVKTLLSLSANMPAWFTNAYRKRNCPELMRLLVCFDRLKEATALAIELIHEAKLQVGTNLYGMQNACGKSTWLPHTITEQLLYILEDQRMIEEKEELYTSLKDAYDEYIHICETVSDDAIQASRQRKTVSMKH